MNVGTYGPEQPQFGHQGQRRDLNGGEQWRFKFPNGYGASVVSHEYSYGGKAGLWELAVLDSDGDLTYETSITSDVIGYLDADDVGPILDRVAALPERT